jgi:hypothetical protein
MTHEAHCYGVLVSKVRRLSLSFKLLHFDRIAGRMRPRWEQQAHTLRVRGLSMARQPVRYSASRLRATSTLVAVVSLSNGVPRCSQDMWG